MLLPQPENIEDNEETDPRAELVRRLLAYEQMKLAAQELDSLPRAGRDFAWAYLPLELAATERLPEIELNDLKQAWLAILARAQQHQHHTVSKETLSVREFMSHILRQLKHGALTFSALFEPQKGVAHVVVSFIALLELIKEGMLSVSQESPFAEIHISLHQSLNER